MSTTASTWYFVAAGERVGPCSLDEMRGRLAQGVVTPETLVWTQGMTAWTAAGELPILSAPPADEPVEAPPPTPVAPPQVPTAPAAVLAWRRFFARWFDTMILMGVGLMAAGYTPERLAALSPAVVLLAPLATLVVQALSIAATGTTPGKALIGLRLRTLDGRLPPLGTALLREGYAWVLGMGFGLTLILPVTHAFSYYRVTRYGTTPWDEKLGVRMEMHTLGTVRSVVVLLLVAVGTLGVVTGIQMMMNP